METTAVASWHGNNGTCGAITTDSTALVNVPYSGHPDSHRGSTNPPELIAAAHAACFSASLAAVLNRAGLLPQTIRTTSIITYTPSPYGWNVSGAALEVVASIREATQSDFISAAVEAKLLCPVCRLLNTDITMSARLEH